MIAVAGLPLYVCPSAPAAGTGVATLAFVDGATHCPYCAKPIAEHRRVA